MKNKRILSEYWQKHFVSEYEPGTDKGGHCTLCGNTGLIDTTGRAYTPAGVHVGRKNYCICPNGRIKNPRDK